MLHEFLWGEVLVPKYNLTHGILKHLSLSNVVFYCISLEILKKKQQLGHTEFPISNWEGM